MDTKVKWLMSLVAVLVVLNVALLAFLWTSKKNDVNYTNRPGDGRAYLIKSLKLNDKQQQQFDSLRKNHFEQMTSYNEEMRRLKDELFDNLHQPAIGNIDSITNRIGEIQSKIDLQTFRHFSAVRAMLNEDQKSKFDITIKDVLHRMAPKGDRPPGPGEREGGPPPNGAPGDGLPPDAPPH